MDRTNDNILSSIYVPYDKAKSIKIKCDMICQPLPVNFEIIEESREVVLLPVIIKDIEKFEIPDYITAVGDWAFEDCYKLQDVMIPDSVKRIGEGAFHNCISLQSVKLPTGLIIISDQTFAGCTSLENIELGSDLKEIGNWAFSGTLISRNMILDTVKIISDMAFENY